ncbi:hypothetical protein KDA_65400 [Dictyobacter alpinus]|uniref:GAF domain-containing protein n=1 Tax=Dictyobacter alpinus TaxID=2014873 RepID=A0A402BIB4_9CHLR|nr:helix-turn-helix domain-containing protein [Dictyobacter alpinus]GCE31056.1 hypothetical protein KDA_65400 [Dictyobacter alpinus]
MKTHGLAQKEMLASLSLAETVYTQSPQLVYSSAEKQQPDLHAVLFKLVNTITLPLRLPEMLHLLTEMIVQSLDIDLCMIMLRGQANDILRQCASHPEIPTSNIQKQHLRISPTLWEHLRTFTLQGCLPILTSQEAVQLNPLQENAYKTFISIPLCVGNECLGLLNCYTQRELDYDRDEQLILNTIANQTALAIKHRRYVEEDIIAQNNLIRLFVDDLLAGKAEAEAILQRRAYIVGFDLAKSHVVAVVELSEVTETVDDKNVSNTTGQEKSLHYNTALTRIKQSLQALYPGVLIDEREAGLVCLLPCDSDLTLEYLNTQLEPLIKANRQESYVSISIGIGTCCQAISNYSRSYAEASEALQVGSCFKTDLHCTHFAELGAYRYLYPFAQTQELSDQYQDCILAVLRYDLRKKTNLLDTLEVYLECGGNIAKTACTLDVHRNTLLQRISRIQKLCALDIDHMPYRLPLLMALKVYRLRAHQLHSNETVETSIPL